MDEATKAEFKKLFAVSDPIIVDPNALERKSTNLSAIVREFRDVPEKGYAWTDCVRRLPQDGKTIVFAVNKRLLAHKANAGQACFNSDTVAQDGGITGWN